MVSDLNQEPSSLLSDSSRTQPGQDPVTNHTHHEQVFQELREKNEGLKGILVRSEQQAADQCIS
jgi:hypothetical protein